MKNLSVKVGDKGRYGSSRGCVCEVVYVKPRSGCFVTACDMYMPQVHNQDGTSHRASPTGNFMFVPEPKTVRAAVWADREGRVYANLVQDSGYSMPHCQIVTLVVPQ